MALHCPDCGEQIVSRRTGFCPGCHRPLPEKLRLSEADKERMDTEFERARRALKSSREHDGGFWGDFGDGDGGD